MDTSRLIARTVMLTVLMTSALALSACSGCEDDADACSNGARDAGEEGIDCGASCGPCQAVILTISAPTDGETINEAQPTARGTSAPGATIQLRFDDTAPLTVTANAQGVWSQRAPQLADGPHTLTATTVSAQEISATATVSFNVAANAPPISITSPIQNAHVNTLTPTLSGQTASQLRVTLWADDVELGAAQADASGAWQITSAALAEGEVVLEARVEDAQGNVGRASVALTLDVTPPLLTIDAPAEEELIETSPLMLMGSSEPGLAVTLNLNGAEAARAEVDDAGQWQSSVTIDLTTPEQALEATVTDLAGNTTRLERTLDVFTDPLSDLAAGANLWCGISIETRAVRCLGSNAQGQATPPAGEFTEVAAGDTFACALDQAGAITCWGNATSDRLSAPAGAFTALALGESHGCALDAAGAVTCWGGGSPSSKRTPPAETFTQIAAGTTASCGITQAQAVVCWGAPALVTSAPNSGAWREVSVGASFACALDQAGAITCWGSASIPAALEPPSGTFEAIALGANHACARGADQRVSCWGQDSAGQATPPTRALGKLSLSQDTSCALSPAGAPVCWGAAP